MCKNAEPMLSVIMPVYNEAATVNEAIRRVLAAPFEKQLIVIDDGSTDGTPSALVEWADQERVVRLRHDRNRGKGAAIRTGLVYAEGRFTVIQDADLECDPRDYLRRCSRCFVRKRTSCSVPDTCAGEESGAIGV